MSCCDMITIIGPTASGKTGLAVAVADRLDSEIISADSRQVYRRMDIGTGKDLADYRINGRQIPYNLIDIAEPGTKYNLFQYQADFLDAYKRIREEDKIPVLCGGTGLYIESILKGYRLIPVPENPELRKSLEGKTLSELTEILKGYKQLHNTTDVDTAKRAIRAIEIEECYKNTPVSEQEFPKIDSIVFGIDVSRETRRENISRRLNTRLDNGMVEEVRALLDEGIAPEDLEYYGLEYKFVTQYITGRLDYRHLVSELEVAIHQFAKRQMTWFRGMERRGININWLPYGMSVENMAEQVCRMLKS